MYLNSETTNNIRNIYNFVKYIVEISTRCYVRNVYNS